jgi:hypothetical protein
MAEGQLRTIGNFNSLGEALSAQSVLAAEGIPSFIPDEFVAGNIWQLGNAIGGIRLQVEGEDADAALEVLRDPGPLAGDDLPVQESEEALLEGCPRCGAESPRLVRVDRRTRGWTMLFWPLLFAIPFLSKRRWQCSICGHQWEWTGTSGPHD